MTSPASGALSSSVLVLNRFYMAVHVVNVRRALGLLFRELAEVIHLEEGQYANYNFQSWREISALRASFKKQHEDWIRASTSSCKPRASSGYCRTIACRGKHCDFNRRNLFARRQSLSVLRPLVSHQRVEPGSHRPAQPRWRYQLGKRSVCLRGLQHAQEGAVRRRRRT